MRCCPVRFDGTDMVHIIDKRCLLNEACTKMARLSVQLQDQTCGVAILCFGSCIIRDSNGLDLVAASISDSITGRVQDELDQIFSAFAGTALPDAMSPHCCSEKESDCRVAAASLKIPIVYKAPLREVTLSNALPGYVWLCAVSFLFGRRHFGPGRLSLGRHVAGITQGAEKCREGRRMRLDAVPYFCSLNLAELDVISARHS